MNSVIQESLLIGRTVEFSSSKEKLEQGRIHCKVDMREHANDTYTITGYMIEDANRKLRPIAYWRVLRIIE